MKFEKLLKKVHADQTDWNWLADRFIEFVYENPETETAKSFKEWLEDTPEDKTIDGFFRNYVYPSQSYESQKKEIEEFIEDWVEKEDREEFRNYIKGLLR